jgi:hypothetical protein
MSAQAVGDWDDAGMVGDVSLTAVGRDIISKLFLSAAAEEGRGFG